MASLRTTIGVSVSGEAPVEGPGLAESLRSGEHAGPGSLGRVRGLGIPVGDHQDLERARVPVGPEVVDLVRDHPGLTEGRHENRQAG